MERVCASPALVGDDRNLCPARNTCQCGYLLIIRRIANLDEEAEVVLDTILVPIFHLEFSDVPLRPLTKPSWGFVQTFTFWDQSIFAPKGFVGTRQRPAIGVWVCR